jgi:hypothetical protein
MLKAFNRVTVSWMKLGEAVCGVEMWARRTCCPSIRQVLPTVPVPLRLVGFSVMPREKPIEQHTDPGDQQQDGKDDAAKEQ